VKTHSFRHIFCLKKKKSRTGFLFQNDAESYVHKMTKKYQHPHSCSLADFFSHWNRDFLVKTHRSGIFVGLKKNKLARERIPRRKWCLIMYCKMKKKYYLPPSCSLADCFSHKQAHFCEITLFQTFFLSGKKMGADFSKTKQFGIMYLKMKKDITALLLARSQLFGPQK